MRFILANTIWAPIFVFCYNWPFALLCTVVGFAAEVGVFRIYTRPRLPLRKTIRRLIAANLASYVVGFVLLLFVPLDIHKSSLGETVLAFVIAYAITVPVEFYVVRSLLPTNRDLLLRAVAMGNFVSYAILFTGYFLWFAGLWYFLRSWS